MNSRDQIDKLAREARRDVGNEANLLWAGSGIAVLFLVLFAAPANFMDWVLLRIDPFAFAIIAGIMLGGMIAYFYKRAIGPGVDRSRAEFEQYQREYREIREAEKQAQIAAMKKDEGLK